MVKVFFSSYLTPVVQDSKARNFGPRITRYGQSVQLYLPPHMFLSCTFLYTQLHGLFESEKSEKTAAESTQSQENRS